MKSKLIIVIVGLWFSVLQIAAQMPVDGGVYRIVNSGRSNAVITEDFGVNSLFCTGVGDKTNYAQLWIFTIDGSGWNIQNVYSGRYIQRQNSYYTSYKTATDAQTLYVSLNNTIANCYNIRNNIGGIGLHCDGSYVVVPWSVGSNTAGGSEWTFEKIDITDEEIERVRQEYDAFINLQTNQEAIAHLYMSFFTSELCTALKAEYAAMNDDQLSAAMNGCPSSLINVAIKIKNDDWANREEEYRIHHYEAYSNPDDWASRLSTFRYSWLNNPTGIYGNTGDLIYLFVGDDIPDNASLQVDQITGNGASGNRTTLQKGMNILAITRDESMLFIVYTADTMNELTLTDFSAIPIHIQGGVLNGYWDKSRHTDTDWIAISQQLATHKYIQVKGDHVIFNMERQYLIAENCCKNSITDAIGWWDNMAVWQQSLMGWDEVKPLRFNNKLCAVSTESGYQSAGNYTTNYVNNYIKNLLPLQRVLSNADNAWGPAHENGHVHQGTINMIACSEVSNNLFSNLTLLGLGKYMSRGGLISEIANEYSRDIPWSSRGGGVSLRMYWQLYLYYHLAGNNPNFYPTLFKLLRQDPLVKRSGNNINLGNTDLLHFAEKCCEASGEDMTDFFEAWGFFVPMNRKEYDDYATYYLTSTEEMIRDTKDKMATYSKRSGVIQFIEDRIQHVARTDGGEGNKIANGVEVGNAGDIGHYTDFLPEKMCQVAEGYLYTQTGRSILFGYGTGAVGFKIYNSENTLLTFTNCFELTLSDEMFTQSLVFKAISANGDESIVMPISEGSIEAQKDALEKVLVVAREFLNMRDDTNSKVGYYYGYALTRLEEIIAGAQQAIDDEESPYSCGQWVDLINDEMQDLLAATDIRVSIQPGNFYRLVNVAYPSFMMNNQSGNLNCVFTNVLGESSKFEFVMAENNDEYFIRSKDGTFINSIERSTTVTSNVVDMNNALHFKAVNAGDATYYITRVGGNGLVLHCDAGKSVVGWYSDNIASRWQIVAVEKNKESADKALLESLVSEANDIIAEVVNQGLSTSSHLVYHSYIVELDVELTNHLWLLMSEIEQANRLMAEDATHLYTQQQSVLSTLLSKVRDGYTLATGIENISQESKEDVIFDIDGQKVNQTQSKRVYIVNGQKVLME